MRRVLSGIVVLALLLLPASASADKPVAVDSQGIESAWEHSGCTTIQEGILTYSSGHYLEGQPLETGFDPYGYNYQAHYFRGSYAN
ncbi:MAG: hypothetical protein QME94_13385, partial [Anaerolineae bacterium]|nr:hypothetical protein [Anaerolineae bacterium]